MDDRKYRRSEDVEKKILWELSERVANIQKLLQEKTISYDRILEKLIEKQNLRPCRTHAWRIKVIEKVLYVLGAGVVSLFIRACYVWMGSI